MEPSVRDRHYSRPVLVVLVVSAAPTPVGPPKRTRDAVILAIAATPDDLARLIKDRSSEDLLSPSRDGGWGVVEVLAHLRDWEEVFLERLRIAVTEDHPFLPTYDDELWPIERDYRGQEPGQTLARFRELRGEVVAFLQGLPAEAWDRVSTHGTFGDVTVLWMADHICDHDKEHLEQARDALA